ncbi:MAG: sugar phosphate isomerase/epimerase family protein [Clostridia bacterium]
MIPAYLIWQGINLVAGIRMLKGAIYHFHAKDNDRSLQYSSDRCPDTKHYSDIENRAWVFRTVGYGTGEQKWKEMVTALKTAGYDGVMSIEHEDSMMSVKEGLEKAIALLKNVLVYEQPGEMWWA